MKLTSLFPLVALAGPIRWVWLALLLVGSPDLVAQGICDRTPQVRDKLVELTGAGSCEQVTAKHLAALDPDHSTYWELNLNNSGITQLRPGDFEGLINVRVLFLELNELTSLPEGVFRGLDSLTKISLNGNALTDLPEGIFQDTPAMYHLEFIDNELESLPEGIFHNLDNFHVLFLHNNHLADLPEGIFRDNPKLEVLWLQRNRLSRLPEEIFAGLYDLQQLLLYDNQLADLPAGIFRNLGNVLDLWLMDNELESLPEGIFDGLENLELLLLWRNHLRRLPETVFRKLGKLRKLSLFANPLGTLPPEIFRGLGALKVLDLERTGLTGLPEDLFDGLEKVVGIQLQGNDLETLSLGIFDGLDNLAGLVLQANPRLRQLPVGIFDDVLDSLGEWREPVVRGGYINGELLLDPHLQATCSFVSAGQRASQGGTLKAEVNLSRPLPVAVRVPFTVGGTAMAEDYSALSPDPEEGLLFLAGETRKGISLRLAEDGDNPDPRIVLTLAPLEGIRVRRSDGSGPDAPFFNARDVVVRPEWGASHTIAVLPFEAAAFGSEALEGKQLVLEGTTAGGEGDRMVVVFEPGGRFQTVEPDRGAGIYEYMQGEANRGTVTLTFQDRGPCAVELEFYSTDLGQVRHGCSDGRLVEGRFRLMREASLAVVPVLVDGAGLKGSYFTSELTLTNRGEVDVRVEFTYHAHVGGGSGTASALLGAGRQQVMPDALAYLRSLGIGIPDSGKRIGLLEVDYPTGTEVSVMTRTTTRVPEGRAGLAYPGIRGDEAFREPVYLCGLRQNASDRSNVAFQNLGTPQDGPITLRTTVYSGDPALPRTEVLPDVTLEPGGFYQYSGVLGGIAQGYVKVERVSGTGGFYAYGVINDQGNSDGSFLFPVTARSLAGTTGQTLPAVVETGAFSTELILTNVSGKRKTLQVALGPAEPWWTLHHPLLAGPPVTLEAGEQRILPHLISQWREAGIEGLASSVQRVLFVNAGEDDFSGVVVGARTGAPAAAGQYSVFYPGVPFGQGFGDEAWIEALQQNEHNRSNLALVNTGAVDLTRSYFEVEIYDGDTGRRVNTLTGITVLPRRRLQFNSILADYAPGTTQGYVRIRKVQGANPFLAYGIINDGGAPGERSGDGAYLPAAE